MIWIIGAKGMLGQAVCQELENRKPSPGQETDHKRDSKASGNDFLATDKDVDICQPEELSAFTEAHPGIKAIINCSAYTQVDRAEEEEERAYQINAEGVANIARSARALDIPLVHISTDYVFPGTESQPLRETDPTGPVSAYGRSKLAGENLATDIHQRLFILRTAWLYGPGGKNFVSTMISLMQSRDALKVINDQIGSPTYAPMLARAALDILQSQQYGIYHYSDEGRISWYDFAVAIQDKALEAGLLHKKIPVEAVNSEEFPTAAQRPAFSLLNTSKIQELGITVNNWQVNLGNYVAWLARHSK